jgi:hypothetical protein
VGAPERPARPARPTGSDTAAVVEATDAKHAATDTDSALNQASADTYGTSDTAGSPESEAPGAVGNPSGHGSEPADGRDAG